MKLEEFKYCPVCNSKLIINNLAHTVQCDFQNKENIWCFFVAYTNNFFHYLVCNELVFQPCNGENYSLHKKGKLVRLISKKEFNLSIKNIYKLLQEELLFS